MLQSIAGRGLNPFYLWGMELLLKIYHDKPARLGVKYTYEYQARKAYEALVSKHSGDRFLLRLEPLKHTVNLLLHAEHSGITIPYQALGYKPELLHKLESTRRSDLGLQFVHLYSEANTLLIAKPFKRQEFFTLSRFEIIGSQLYT